MDVFGDHWRDHAAVIERSWRDQIAADDLVLLPGDISWAMHIQDAMADLAWIDALPGRKVMCKGNHDYWWSSKGKVRAVLPPSISVVDCDALLVDDVVLCGTRGWAVPGDRDFNKTTDLRIYERELNRLDRALAGAQVLAISRPSATRSRPSSPAGSPPLAPRAASTATCTRPTSGPTPRPGLSRASTITSPPAMRCSSRPFSLIAVYTNQHR